MATTALESLTLAFKNQDLLVQALTHKSFHNENPSQSAGHNERLEFLGDAVLELILSEMLFADHQDLNEGQMSKLRASLVNEKSLADVSFNFGLSTVIRFGKGEQLTGGALKPRLLACALEALIGALYLDQGLPAAKEFVSGLFQEKLKNVEADNCFVDDFKTRLQELAQEKFKAAPTYEHMGSDGPDHDRVFKVKVILNNSFSALGQGRSKKQAEQHAAGLALKELEK